LKGFPLYDEILPLVKGWHATGELAYHILECDSSIAPNVDGGDNEDVEGFKHGSLSLFLDEPEETCEWPLSVSSNLIIYVILMV
jgi:hypothetical protein